MYESVAQLFAIGSQLVEVYPDYHPVTQSEVSICVECHVYPEQV